MKGKGGRKGKEGSQHSRLPIGMYFGMFDPPHKNHMNNCRVLLNNRTFRKIIIVVNGDGKEGKEGAMQQPQRHEMCELARTAAGLTDDECCVKSFHHDSGKYGWRQRIDFYRDATGSRTAHFIVGADSFNKSMTNARDMQEGEWQRMKVPVFLWHRLYVLPRKLEDGSTESLTPASQARLSVLDGQGDHVKGNVTELDCPDEEIMSSSSIREKIKHNEDLTLYLAESVQEYITENNLYPRTPRPSAQVQASSVACASTDAISA